MVKGKVAPFESSGGYSFIRINDHDGDVFFHMEDIEGPGPEKGWEVKFDIKETDKGSRMASITRF